MFKTIWTAVLVCVCLAATVCGAAETSLPGNGVLARPSGGSFASDFSVASVEGGVRSISVVPDKPYDRRFLPIINAVTDEMQALAIPGAAVAIIEAGETTFAAGFGSRHPHRDDPVKASTLFRIGSVTKMLTAIGLLQLVEQGLVDLNSPITDYVPEFSFAYDANWAPSITPQHLLTHTTAMADYIEIDTPGFKDDDALSTFFSGPYGQSPYAYLMAPAGRMFNYSNPGYMLAGWITESVGQSYYRYYLEENVLAPLGMTRTFFLPEQVIADGDFAYGSTPHWETGEPFVVEPNSYDNGWARPAGFAFSSVLDLAELVKFIRAGRPEVLSDEMRMAMQEPQMDTEWFMNLVHYGYGLMIQEGGFYHPTASNFYRMRIISHGGDVYGFSADMYYVPDLDFGFVALTNAGVAHLSTSFAKAMTMLCEMPAPAPWPDFSGTPANYSGYCGHYYDQFNVGDVMVKSGAGQLTVEMPLLEAMGVGYEPTLAWSSGDNFILYLNEHPMYGRLPLQVTFIFDDYGQTEYFRTRSFVARYVAESPPEPPGRGRFESFRPTESLPVSDFKSYLPGPQLPFITPPGQ